MAKKKSTSSTSSTSSEKKAPAKRAAKASSNGKPAKTSAKKSNSAAFDGEQIGLTAGTVWGVLSQSGDTTLSALKKEVDSPGDLVTAAIGWLAREEKLSFASSGRSVKISLK